MTHCGAPAIPRRRRLRGVLGSVVAALVLSACGAKSDGSYVVRPGDTLSGIGQRYGVPYEEIARANRLRDPSRIVPGQVLTIPQRSRRQARAPESPQRATHRRSDASPAGLQLLWPVAGGEVSSGFGPRGSGFHDGVDIRAPEGTPVLAAERGKVAFSGQRQGYGNVVAIRHPGGLTTVYAHNQSNWVRSGQAVRRGEVIATVGQTGRTTGPNLHFELWRDGRRLDPLPHLEVPILEAHRSP